MEMKVTSRMQFGVCLIFSWVWLALELPLSAPDLDAGMVSSTVRCWTS